MARAKMMHKGMLLPPAQAFGQIAEVATTIEAAEYAYHQTEAKFTEAGVINKGPAQSMLKKMDNLRQNVNLQRGPNGQPWSGQIDAENGFENLQQNLAKQETKDMAEKIQDKSVVMDFAISDKGEFRRGLSVDGVELDAGKKSDRGTIEAVDNLFNTWLADDQLISDDSVIYESDGNGNILTDEDGNKVRADGGELRELMNGDNGFEAYMQDKGLDVTTRQQTFPGEEPTVSQKQQQVIQPTAGKEEKIEETPDYESVRAPK